MEEFKPGQQKITERKFKGGEHSLFGYTGFIEEDGKIIGLKGEHFEGREDLYVDMEVELEGDSRGYVPAGFHDKEKVRIVEFVEPFENNHSDHIVVVAAADGRTGRVKPSNVKRPDKN